MARNKFDVDEALESKFDANQLKRLYSYVGPYKGKLLFVIFLMLISSALGMMIPKFFQQVLDDYIPNENIKGIVWISILTFVIVLVNALFARIKIILTSQVGQNIIHAMRKELFDQLQRLPFSYYDSRPHKNSNIMLVTLFLQSKEMEMPWESRTQPTKK